MAGLFELIIVVLFFYIALTIAGFFITVDILYFICCAKRLPKAFRLTYEIVGLCVTTVAIIFLSSLDREVENSPNPEMLTIAYVFALPTYFISSYSPKVFSLYVEIVLALGIISGCIANILFTTSQITNIGWNFTVIVGCIPTLCLFTIALIQQCKRCREAYSNKKTIN